MGNHSKIMKQWCPVFTQSYGLSIGSLCPLPRRARVTTANAIAIPITAPYTATDASAIEQPLFI